MSVRLTVGLAGNIRKHTRVDIMSNSRITEREFTFYLESLKTVHTYIHTYIHAYNRAIIPEVMLATIPF